MVEMVLTWGFVEKNIELIMERIRAGDEKTFDAMKILFEINMERYMDLLNCWESKNMCSYFKKWYPENEKKD